MAAFPGEYRFRGAWRPYQERVLAELDLHLDDDRLHLVAAPGSGKTVVGLEVVRRLDAPTLVVAPTLAVRDQWVQRLRELFLGADGGTGWVATDLDGAATLTVTTYQALHSGWPEVRTALQEAGFGTLVLDEAHHLRRSWWESLTEARRALQEPTVVALTATPPYDVPDEEWDNYVELCGPVDAEISIPELVREGNLCPHQDLVRLCPPRPTERRRLDAFDEAASAIVADLREDDALRKALERHPWVRSPDECTGEIRAEPARAAAVLVHLSATAWWTPWRLRRHMGLAASEIPDLDRTWMEPLLELVLADDRLDYDRQALRERLDDAGALDGGSVHLRAPPPLVEMLEQSPGKLDAVTDIVASEARALGDDLRLVVLTDRIRRSALPDATGKEPDLDRMGAVPVFERLRRDLGDRVPPAVLTGSLVLVPVRAEEALRRSAKAVGVPAEALRLAPLAHDGGFARLEVDGGRAVPVVTEAFQRGALPVVVGTAALLGEGWDAPAINALVLASSVGSTMQSNQMRGRAIRVQPGRPDKTANVWHLATVAPDRTEPQPDLDVLRRRFRAFVGLDHRTAGVRDGLDRLDMEDPPYDAEAIDAVNARTGGRARDRDAVRAHWEQAVGDGDEVVEELEVPDDRLPGRRARVRGGLTAVLVAALAVLAAGVGLAPPPGLPALPLVGRLPYPVLAAILSAVVALAGGRDLVRLVRHRNDRASLRSTGRAVLEALQAVGDVDERDQARVAVRTEDEALVCTLRGVTTQDRSRFLAALETVLDPVGDTRYLLATTPWPSRLRRTTYRAVPGDLATRKERARTLLGPWRRRVGKARLVYTRHGSGRLALLRARIRAMVAETTRCRRRKVWTRVPDHPLIETLRRVRAAATRQG